MTQATGINSNDFLQVNEAVTLGKPIIPLLMEKMTWPPSGSMGPIFGEYLFIRFFTRPGEETGDQRFWSPDKFQELLMQLRYNIIPDESLVKDGKNVQDTREYYLGILYKLDCFSYCFVTCTSEYKKWWDPPEEEIVITPKAKEMNIGTKVTESTESEKGGEVCFSLKLPNDKKCNLN